MTLHSCRSGSSEKGRQAVFLDMGEYLRSSHTSTTPTTLPIHIPAPADQLNKGGQGGGDAVTADARQQPSAFSKLQQEVGHGKIVPLFTDTSTASTSGRGGSGKVFAEAATTTAGSRGPGSGQRMRLYQVLAPSLLARGRIFGGKLALKAEWLALDSPYFSAPGEQLVTNVPCGQLLQCNR